MVSLCNRWDAGARGSQAKKITRNTGVEIGGRMKITTAIKLPMLRQAAKRDILEQLILACCMDNGRHHGK